METEKKRKGFERKDPDGLTETISFRVSKAHKDRHDAILDYRKKHGYSADAREMHLQMMDYIQVNNYWTTFRGINAKPEKAPAPEPQPETNNEVDE
jgi:AICAR transformylase/IMP cyclohydrolase PurH